MLHHLSVNRPARPRLPLRIWRTILDLAFDPRTLATGAVGDRFRARGCWDWAGLSAYFLWRGSSTGALEQPSEPVLYSTAVYDVEREGGVKLTPLNGAGTAGLIRCSLTGALTGLVAASDLLCLPLVCSGYYSRLM